ncbi:MAG: hypothetical protein K6F44_03985 [Lachnospiraceae bacterium]|nr:hypothetical protein [Lachnospiraceae bacterium]
MNRRKSDPFIDLAYMCALLVVLGFFVFAFFCSRAFAHEILVNPNEGVETVLLEKAVSAFGEALLSVVFFSFLMICTIIMHELGHALGGFVAGYRAAHFCVFGICLSFGKKKVFRFDRSAVFGGYVVMCAKDPEKSPLLLLRMGPLAECLFLSLVAAIVAIGETSVTGIFLLGETVAYFFVRMAMSGKSREDDSSTAAQVLEEGPGYYNRLMDVYDEMISGKGEMRNDASVKTSGDLPAAADVHSSSMTVREELLLYEKKK